MRQLRTLATIVCFLALVVIAAGCVGPAATPAPSAIPMALYENTEHGFSIEYPEGWAENVQELGTNFSFEFKDPGELISASVSVEYKAEDIILVDLVSEGKEYLEYMPQYELILEGDVTIGEVISGYEIVGKGELGAGKVEKFRFVVLTRGKQGFWVGVRGEPADFEQQEQMINTITNSFKLLPSYTFVPQIPSEGGIYTSEEHGFSVSYPAGWMEAPTGRHGEIITLSSVEGLPSVTFSVFPVGEETTLAEFIPQLKEDLSKRVGDYDLVSEGEITLDDGTPAYEIVFSGIMEGYALKAKYVIVIRRANVFLAQGFTMPPRFEQDEAAIDEVIHSFHLE